MKEQTHFQNQEVHQITEGNSVARFSPAHGARLLDWWVDGRPVIFWPADADWSNLVKVKGGNPILFPFIARHFVNGVLGQWRDEAGTVYELPMHGFARASAFTVVDDPEPNTLRMRLEQTPETLKGYPFPFRFEVIYRLGPASLEVEFATTNTGTKPLPYYAGHHFYFAIDHTKRADWELTLPFRKTGTQAADGRILDGPPPLTATLDQPELIDRFQIDPTTARFSLTNRQDGTAIEFDLHPKETVPWYAVTTWTQTPESDFYCVEPWLGLPNAIDHGQGLRHVAPGATERAVCALHFHAPKK